MWATEKSIHKRLTAAHGQSELENAGWCYSLYLEPSKPCRDKGAQTGRLTVWPQALGPKNTALKTSESCGGRRIKCKCAQVRRKPKTAISQRIGTWQRSRSHQPRRLPRYFKGGTRTDKSCPTLSTAHS